MILKYFFCTCLMASPLVGVLTYDQALQMTLIQSPALSLSLMEIEEREGERVQSGLYFNPVFSYSVENVFGNHCWNGWRSAESRYEISQPVEIGGKRGHRTAKACYLIQAAQYEHAYLELETINRMKKAFLNVVRAQEFLKLAQHQQQIAVETVSAVQQKAAVGKIAPIEKIKAELSMANSELAWEKACMGLEVARQELALFWGAKHPDFDSIDYPFFNFNCPPCLEECLQENENHPLILKVRYLELAAREGVEMEKASAIPDVVFTAGLKTVEDTGNKGMILGIAFPLPLFDRNQGTICQARALKARMANEYFEKELLLKSRLCVLHKEAMRAYNEVMRLNATILALAQESFEMVREGYAAGKMEYLELLEAGSTLLNVEERYIETLHTFFEKQTDIEYLTL